MNELTLFADLARFGSQTAASEAHTSITYEELERYVQLRATSLPSQRSLILLKSSNTIAFLVDYLACIRGRHVAILIDGENSLVLEQTICRHYRPNGVLEQGHFSELSDREHALDEQLVLLLTTSGSTGSPKFVALSERNLLSNMEAICRYLPIQPDDRAITTLPPAYSYGLSVINTHLYKGAGILFNQHPVISREFWTLFEELGATTLAGVPHSYDMLLRLGLTKKALPSLRYFTQAGGRLNPDTVKRLHAYAEERHKAFYVMYGQTEATARMAFLPHDKVGVKPGSIGQAIPGGRLRLVDENGQELEAAHCEGELQYSGDNVMLGYAEGCEELARFDDIAWLKTGDIGYRDEQGDYYVTGRSKRITKLQGKRINLDEVEQHLLQEGIESFCGGNDDVLLVSITQEGDTEQVKQIVKSLLSLHPAFVKVMPLQSLPYTEAGKKDYPTAWKLYEQQC